MNLQKLRRKVAATVLQSFTTSDLTLFIDFQLQSPALPDHISFVLYTSIIELYGYRDCMGGSGLQSIFPCPMFFLAHPFPSGTKKNCNNWMPSLTVH